MEYYALARVIHIMAVVIWIGGVAMVTSVIFPLSAALNRLMSR